MITITANARDATYVSDDLITSGSVGIPAKFVLSEDYDGLSNIAVFVGSGVSMDVALPSSGECVVPHEAVAQPGGYLKIGVYGRNAEGTIVIPTVWAMERMILQGAVPSGVDPSEPTPDWTTQVQQMATEALANSEEAIEIAGGAEAAAADARQSASAAATSATAAEQSASAAGASQTAAEAASGAAASACDAAVAAQGSAESSATAALESAQTATDASGAAVSARDAAQRYASDADGHARDAAGSATQAGQSAEDAAGSAEAAGQSAEAAAGSAEGAAASGQAAAVAQAGAELAKGKAEDAQAGAEAARGTAEDYRDEVVGAAEGIAQQATAAQILETARQELAALQALIEVNRSVRWYDELPEEGVEGYVYITPDGVFHYHTGEFTQVSGGGDLNGFSLSLDGEDRVVLAYANPEDETDIDEAVFPTGTTGAAILDELQNINAALRMMIPGATEG